MNKKIVVLDDFKKLNSVESVYDGYVVKNGVYVFYGNTKDRVNEAKKVLIKKFMHCVDKMKQNGWDIIYG